MKIDFVKDFKDSRWQNVAKIICEKHKISGNVFRRSEHGESIVFLIDRSFVVKIYVPTKNGCERELQALETAVTSIRLPEIVAHGQFENLNYLITTQLPGELITREIWLALERDEQVKMLAELAEGLRELHDSDASKIDFDWQKFVAHKAETCLARQTACGVNAEVLSSLPSFLEENLKLLPDAPKQVFMHGDVHFGNLRFLKINGHWRISGLFDFADCLKGFHEYEFIAIGVLMVQGQGDLQREFFRAFGYSDALINEDLRRRMMLLTCFYEWSDLRRYAIRLRPEAVDYSLEKLEKSIWSFV